MYTFTIQSTSDINSKSFNMARDQSCLCILSARPRPIPLALFFTDEATIHPSGRLDRYNLRIWVIKNLHDSPQHERGPENFNIFAAVVQVKQCGPFFFVKFPVTCVRLLNIYIYIGLSLLELLVTFTLNASLTDYCS
jgi:hypothetical protein